MKTVLTAGGVLILGILAWLLGTRLSSDALGMAVGVTLGILAMVPTVLLVLHALGNSRERDDYEYERRPQLSAPPVVIVYAPPAQLPAQTHNHAPVQHNYYVAPPTSQEWQPPTVQAACRPALPGPAAQAQAQAAPHPGPYPRFRVVGQVEADDEW